MGYLSVFSKPSSMLTLKLMSFNGDYVKEYILFLPKLQLFNVKTIPVKCEHIKEEIEIKIDKVNHS